MASLTKENANGRKGWRLRFYQNGKRRSLWIGDVSKRIADGVAFNVDLLVQAKETGMRPDAKAIEWADSVDDRIRGTLVKWSLIDPQAKRTDVDANRLLGPFLDDYIAGRTDLGQGTTTNYKQARRLLVEYFKADKPLAAITAADADRWRRWLLSRVVKEKTETTPAKTMAKATVSKHIKRTKTMFAHAVRDRLIDQSPFADQKGGSEANKDRQHFVDRQVTAAVLAACPDHDWRVIFALARYAGLRCPSEVTAIRWDDILWDKKRLRIRSPKTGLRFCPIFPELLPILEAAYDDAADGAIFCVGRYGGDGSANLSTTLKRFIVNAGQKPWPKTFINLRSTRRTELQEKFPSHVVDEWLGHSTKTAEKHYLQTTESHFFAGASMAVESPVESESIEDQNGGPTGGPISANLGLSSGTTHGTTKPSKHEKTRTRRDLMRVKVTPTGLEPVLPP